MIWQTKFVPGPESPGRVLRDRTVSSSNSSTHVIHKEPCDRLPLVLTTSSCPLKECWPALLAFYVKKMAVAPGNDSCAPLVTEGYTCQFVESPPESLLCPVCLLPFRDPSLLSCCGHKGCALCLGRIKDSGRPCPICQQAFDTMLDKAVQRKVMDLRVYCSEKATGCGWKGELRHLETHTRKDCGYVEQECKYKCGIRNQRRLLRSHEEEECPQRPAEVVTQCLVKKMAERVDRLEQIHNEKVTMLLSTIKAIEKSYREDQSKLDQKIQKLQKENATLRDEKAEMNRKMDELQGQYRQQSEHALQG